MAQQVLTANAADARTSVTNADFATARAATTGTLQSASTNPTGIGDLLNGGNYTLHRFHMRFASTGGTGDSVDSATFSFQISGKTGANRIVHLVESSAADVVVEDDFNNVSFTSFGSVEVTGDDVFEITVNATGLNYLATNLGGTIKLALIGVGDQSDVAPTDDSLLPMYTGDEATNQKPTLTVNHTPALARNLGYAFVI